MSTITEPNEYSIEGVVGTDSGNQRVVMTNSFSGTQLTHSTDSVEIICEDGQGNKQRCVAVTHFSDADSNPIPSQTGHNGQFLKTTGSTLVWDDVLQNKATGSLGLSIEGEANGNGAVAIGVGSEANGQSGISVGTSAEGSGDDSLCIGTATRDNGEDYNTIVGSRATSSKALSTVVGYNAKSTAIGAVALGADASATEAGTFVVALSTNGYSGTSFKVLESDGKITPARFAELPITNGNYRLRLTINDGVATYSWVAE